MLANEMIGMSRTVDHRMLPATRAFLHFNVIGRTLFIFANLTFRNHRPFGTDRTDFNGFKQLRAIAFRADIQARRFEKRWISAEKTISNNVFIRRATAVHAYVDALEIYSRDHTAVFAFDAFYADHTAVPVHAVKPAGRYGERKLFAEPAGIKHAAFRTVRIRALRLLSFLYDNRRTASETCFLSCHTENPFIKRLVIYPERHTGTRH